MNVEFVLPYSGLQWSDLPFILTGAWRTILLTVLATVFGTLLGILIGWLRHASPTARIVLAPYVDVTRSVPLIIQFILFNTALGIAGAPFEPLWLGVLVLSLYMGVLTSELVRSGLDSVRREIRRSARSLGLTYRQEMVHVTAPLGLRAVLPSWIGTVIGITKDSALVSVVGYVELLRASQILINRTNEALLVLAGAGLFYFVICYPISRYGRSLERRMQM